MIMDFNSYSSYHNPLLLLLLYPGTPHKKSLGGDSKPLYLPLSLDLSLSLSRSPQPFFRFLSFIVIHRSERFGIVDLKG